MSAITLAHPRRPLAVAGLVLIGLAAALLNRIPATSGGVAVDNEAQTAVHNGGFNSAYFAEFTGVGADGRDMVWRGAVAGASVGELTVRLAHEGRDIDTANPTWPVEGIIVASSEDPQRAFAAEVRGTIDWRTKRVKLAGEVSVGYMRGAHIEQTADLIDHDLSGELHFAPGTLASVR